MKNYLKTTTFVACLAAFFLFSKCSLLETDVDGELNSTLSVNESKTDANIQYSNTMVIDADSDEDIADNLDKIKEWSVSQISYSIWSYDGYPTATFTGSLGFSQRSASSPSINVAMSGLDLSNLSNDNIKHKLNLSESQLNTIAEYFDKDQAIKVYFNGTLSQGPVYFNLEVFAKVKVKAKVL